RSLPGDQFAINLFVDLAGEIDVRRCPAAGLNGDLNNLGFTVINSHIDRRGVDSCLENFLDEVVTDERAAALQDGDGGGLHLVVWAFIPADDGVLARHTEFEVALQSVDATSDKNGQECQRQKCRKASFHGSYANRFKRSVKH